MVSSARRRDWGADRVKVDLLLKSNNNQPTRNKYPRLVPQKDNEASLLAVEIPEIAELGSVQEARRVLQAAVELRRQFHAKPVEPKSAFPGLRALAKAGTDMRRSADSPGPAYRFMRDQYGEEIDSGRLSPADLKEMDPLLYASVANEVEALGQTVGDYLKAGSRDVVYDQRRQACAAIVGAPVEAVTTNQGASFFAALRDRRSMLASRRGHTPSR